MAKTLVVLNESVDYNGNLVRLIRALYNDVNHEHFEGMMVNDLASVNSISNHAGEPSLADFLPFKSDLLNDDIKKKAEILSIFEEHAKESKITYAINNDFRLNSHELLKKTAYADLLMLNYTVFMNRSYRPNSSMIYSILKGSRCPVMVLPSDVSQIDNIIFTFDGKESSMFAIRAFCNLFAETTKDKEITILTVMPSEDEEIENEKLLMDFVKKYYKNIGLQMLVGDNISHEITNFAESVDNPLVVMGAYGRSRISNLFIPSTAKQFLIKGHIPLFIAHR